MTEPQILDLLDEYNCADTCDVTVAFCKLIDHLISDIQHLELECISTRYLLSRHMDPEQGELLRSDILENLGQRYSDDPAYQMFKNLMYDGGDPMDFHEYVFNVRAACRGEWPCWH